MESVAMDDRSIEIPAQVRAFAPKHKPRDGDPTDQTGQALVAMLQEAGKLVDETNGRAMALVHKLSSELEATKDRIGQLQADVERFRDRAADAEKWLQLIQKEIENKLIATF